MRGQGRGTGGEDEARAQREESVQRREKRRLHEASIQAQREPPDNDSQAHTSPREGEFGVDRELSRLPKAERDRLVRGSLRDAPSAAEVQPEEGRS